MSESSFSIIGVYHYPVTKELFQETLKFQWGDDLSGAKLREAESHIRELFDNLYLVEICFDGHIKDYEWSQLTQEIPDQPQENWQVPYDERSLDGTGRRWAFFFHFLDWRKPLLTSFGPLQLPEPSELPSHLLFMKYESP